MPVKILQFSLLDWVEVIHISICTIMHALEISEMTAAMFNKVTLEIRVRSTDHQLCFTQCQFIGGFLHLRWKKVNDAALPTVIHLMTFCVLKNVVINKPRTSNRTSQVERLKFWDLVLGHSDPCRFASNFMKFWCKISVSTNQSGQIIIFHQPGFPWNKGISLTKPPFGRVKSL